MQLDQTTEPREQAPAVYDETRTSKKALDQALTYLPSLYWLLFVVIGGQFSHDNTLLQWMTLPVTVSSFALLILFHYAWYKNKRGLAVFFAVGLFVAGGIA